MLTWRGCCWLLSVMVIANASAPAAERRPRTSRSFTAAEWGRPPYPERGGPSEGSFDWPAVIERSLESLGEIDFGGADGDHWQPGAYDGYVPREARPDRRRDVTRPRVPRNVEPQKQAQVVPNALPPPATTQTEADRRRKRSRTGTFLRTGEEDDPSEESAHDELIDGAFSEEDPVYEPIDEDAAAGDDEWIENPDPQEDGSPEITFPDDEGQAADTEAAESPDAEAEPAASIDSAPPGGDSSGSQPGGSEPAGSEPGGSPPASEPAGQADSTPAATEPAQPATDSDKPDTTTPPGSTEPPGGSGGSGGGGSVPSTTPASGGGSSTGPGPVDLSGWGPDSSTSSGAGASQPGESVSDLIDQAVDDLIESLHAEPAPWPTEYTLDGAPEYLQHDDGALDALNGPEDSPTPIEPTQPPANSADPVGDPSFDGDQPHQPNPFDPAQLPVDSAVNDPSPDAGGGSPDIEGSIREYTFSRHRTEIWGGDAVIDLGLPSVPKLPGHDDDPRVRRRDGNGAESALDQPHHVVTDKGSATIVDAEAETRFVPALKATWTPKEKERPSRERRGTR
jgi:hypothetical protein